MLLIMKTIKLFHVSEMAEVSGTESKLASALVGETRDVCARSSSPLRPSRGRARRQHCARVLERLPPFNYAITRK